MRFSKSQHPNVNAGSMADIAFLLLIFFLVTTTISTDKGINRKLPKHCEPPNCPIIDINERNLLRISINNSNQIMVDDKLVTLQDLKTITKEFLDNNGDNSCTYCNGKQLSTSSDNPKEAVVSLSAGNLTSYHQFIAVQDELTKAYYELRKTYAETSFGKAFGHLNTTEQKQVKEAYPFMLSEAMTK